MKPVIWRERALEQLEDIIDYVDDYNPSAALKIEAEICSCAERVSLLPFGFRNGRVPGTREAVAHPN